MPRPVCSECGKPAVARGLCRLCYDKSRKILRFAISERIKPDVLALAEKNKWEVPYTLNQLLEAGLDWFKKQEQVAKEYKLKS
jgi:NMD protein affecting ribosome stability and mRNA decay